MQQNKKKLEDVPLEFRKNRVDFYTAQRVWQRVDKILKLPPLKTEGFGIEEFLKWAWVDKILAEIKNFCTKSGARFEFNGSKIKQQASEVETDADFFVTLFSSINHWETLGDGNLNNLFSRTIWDFWVLYFWGSSPENLMNKLEIEITKVLMRYSKELYVRYQQEMALAKQEKRLAEAERDIEILFKQARTDKLTWLYNKRWFDEFTDHLAETHEEQSWKVAFVDLDFFKKVNDSFGHEKWNMVLEILSWILKRHVSSEWARAFRYWWEEFVLFIPDHLDISAILETIQHDIRRVIIELTADEIKKTQTLQANRRTAEDKRREHLNGIFPQCRNRQEYDILKDQYDKENPLPPEVRTNDLPEGFKITATIGYRTFRLISNQPEANKLAINEAKEKADDALYVWKREWRDRIINWDDLSDSEVEKLRAMWLRIRDVRNAFPNLVPDWSAPWNDPNTPIVEASEWLWFGTPLDNTSE